MSVTLSIRVDEQVKHDIEILGYKPNEFMKRILYEGIRKERARKALSWLRQNRLKPLKKDSSQLIREDRDRR